MNLRRRAEIGFAAVLAAASLAVAGCGANRDADPDPRVTNVEIQNFTFRPARIEVPAGTKVVWKNLDKAQHTATAEAETGSRFDTGTLSKGASRGVRFTRQGTYAYVCSLHAFMHGTVEVR